MRKPLKARAGQSIRVTALIERYGGSAHGSTYLLQEVRDAATGEMLTDHLWVPVEKWAQGFRPGDLIEFTADVSQYLKGWLGNLEKHGSADLPFPENDWTLSEIRHAEVVEFGPVKRLMPDGLIRGDDA